MKKKYEGKLTGADISAAFDKCELNETIEVIANHLKIRDPEPVLNGADIHAVFNTLAIDHSKRRRTLLDQLGQMAQMAMPIVAVAERLGFSTIEAFETFLADDPEAAEIWQKGLIEAAMTARRALWTLMTAGNAAATRQIVADLESLMGKAGVTFSSVPVRTLESLLGEKPNWISNRMLHDGLIKNVDGTIDLAKFLPWLRSWQARKSAVDIGRMKQFEIAAIFGVSREIVNKQWSLKGMPRNKDGTYNVTACVQWRIDQIGSQPQSSAEIINPLTAEKIRKMKREHDIAMNNLLDRGEVMSGWIARLQNIVNFMSRKIGEVGTALEGQTADAIMIYIEKLFDQIKKTLQQVPDELKLPDEAAALFAECLQSLAERETEQNET